MEVAAFARLEAKIEELLNRLTALTTENAGLKSRLDEKEKEVTELGELMAAQDAERDEVRKRIESLVEKLENY
jgi:cell division protein ZapB